MAAWVRLIQRLTQKEQAGQGQTDDPRILNRDLLQLGHQDFLEQVLVSFLSSRTHPQIVLDGAPNHRLIQEIRDLLPRHIRAHLCHRVAAALRECGKRLVPQIAVGFPYARKSSQTTSP